jgi:hypothetical protein
MGSPSIFFRVVVHDEVAPAIRLHEIAQRLSIALMNVAQSRGQILELRHKQSVGHVRDLRFPSFARMARLIRRSARTYGASAIANPKSNKYHSS